jgi:hypothetical protein
VDHIITAILIPMIILYFYYLSKRERAKQLKEWKQVGKIVEKEEVSGKVIQVISDTETFYHGKYVWRGEITVKTEGSIVKVLIRKPKDDTFSNLTIQKDADITCYGTRSASIFLANRIEINEKEKN